MLRRNRYHATAIPISGRRDSATHYSDECRRESDIFDDDRRAFLRRCAVYFRAASVPADIKKAEVEGTMAAMAALMALTVAGL